MTDKILILFSMALLAVFCGIVFAFIAVPDLAIVMISILGLAMYDFWITVFRPKDAAVRLRDDLEERPGAAAGKTVTSARDLLKE